jgi:hypothetical protein
MAKLVWRVKLVTELQAGETAEVEVARIERDQQASLSELGLRLAEAKQLTSALQAEIIPAQVTIAGEHRCTCAACGRRLASKTSCPFPARGNPGREVRPGLCPGPAKGKALGTSLSVAPSAWAPSTR